MRQLTSLDAQFLAIEDGRTHGHVSMLNVLDPGTAPEGRLTLDAVRALFAERIHLVAPLRWRLVPVPFGLDHPYWAEDPDVDLDYHVREIALPAPGDQRQLTERVARLAGRPLDRSRPLWEVYLIHGLEGGRVALLTKVHHSAIDGMSGAEMAIALLDPSAEGREIPAPDSEWGEEIPGQAEMLRRGLIGAARHPLRAIGGVSRALPHLPTLVSPRMLPWVRPTEGHARRLVRLGIPGAAGLIGKRPPARVPYTLVNGPITPHRRVALESLPLAEVKAIKNQLGCTVNDVVMAVCAGALRSWLLAHDALPEAPLAAMVPVSTRKPEQWGTYGNRINFLAVEVPTDEADPLRRFERAREAMRTAKRRQRGVPDAFLQHAFDAVPPPVFGRVSRTALGLVARGAIESPFNVVISNVMGSPIPLYFAGARIEAMYPVSAVADGVGLNLTLQSYCDRLDFGVVADREHVTDAWEIAAHLRRAYEELRDLTTQEAEAAGQAELTAV